MPTNASFNTPYGNFNGCYVYYSQVTMSSLDEIVSSVFGNEYNEKILSHIRKQAGGKYVYDNYMYFKPNVGYIGWEMYYGNTLIQKKVLTGYHLNWIN